MTTVAILTEALARGGKVVWDPPGKPRLLAPRSLHDAIKADRETVKEILRRGAILRAQAERFIRHGGPLPILALPDAPPGPCISCGGDLAGGWYRCPMCALAVRVALGGRP
jgi:hypothetical protein